MTYYAQRKSIKDGAPVAPNNRYSENRREMERQYHLYCASAAMNEAGNELDEVEWGTVESGILERKVWVNPIPETEPESESE